MDGYPSTPLNLSDGTTVTQAGGGEDETDDEKPFAQVGDLEARWHALTGEEYNRAEALLDPLAAHERLHGADGRGALLDHVVELVHDALQNTVQRRHVAHDERERHGKQR